MVVCFTLNELEIKIVFHPDRPLVNTFSHTFDKPGYGGEIFGKLQNYDSTVKEYGVVFSATDSEPRLGKFNCSKFPSRLGIEADGYYGIQLKGTGILSGITYFAVPYVSYESNDGTLITQYGERIAFTPQSLIVNSFLDTSPLDENGEIK